MPDFQFLFSSLWNQWVVVAPRRGKRPEDIHGEHLVCPFCPGEEGREKEVYRIGGEVGDARWHVRAVSNRFPFAPHHEVIIASPNHNDTYISLTQDQFEELFSVYVARFRRLEKEGQVYIFTNSGKEAGESMIHPHSQLVVIPSDVSLGVPMLPSLFPVEETFSVSDFTLWCPKNSGWPDEVWLIPKRRHNFFGEISPGELSHLAFAYKQVISLMTSRHEGNFPFNMYIAPQKDWYVRIVPRSKNLGGFEVGTGIMVNTQDPKETIEFIRTHFHSPDHDLIRSKHKATYERGS